MGEAKRRQRTAGQNEVSIGIELTVMAGGLDSPVTVSVPAVAVKHILANPIDIPGEVTLGMIVERLKEDQGNGVIASILDYYFQKRRGDNNGQIITQLKQALRDNRRAYLYVADDVEVTTVFANDPVTTPYPDATVYWCMQHAKANTLHSYLTSPDFQYPLPPVGYFVREKMQNVERAAAHGSKVACGIIDAMDQYLAHIPEGGGKCVCCAQYRHSPEEIGGFVLVKTLEFHTLGGICSDCVTLGGDVMMNAAMPFVRKFYPEMCPTVH
jgi:hypothetical protein